MVINQIEFTGYLKENETIWIKLTSELTKIVKDKEEFFGVTNDLLVTWLVIKFFHTN